MTRWPYHLLINLFSSWTYLGFQPCNSRWLWVISSNCAGEHSYSPQMSSFRFQGYSRLWFSGNGQTSLCSPYAHPSYFYSHFVVSLSKLKQVFLLEKSWVLLISFCSVIGVAFLWKFLSSALTFLSCRDQNQSRLHTNINDDQNQNSNEGKAYWKQKENRKLALKSIQRRKYSVKKLNHVRKDEN